MEKESFDREIRLPARIDELDQLLEWLEGILEGQPGKIIHGVCLAVEELFVNIASYAYRGFPEGPLREATIRLALRDSCLILQIEDSGKAFNPLEYPKPDTHAPLEDRPIGGLGIYLTRKVMDEMDYARVGEKNILTFRKNLVGK